VYINNNVSTNSISNIEKEILKLPEVNNLGYSNKEIALQNLAKKLEISSKGINNPLLNSFKVHVIGKESLPKLKEIIVEIKGVKEVVISESRNQKIEDSISKNNKLILGLLILIIIPLKIIIFNIMHGTVISQNHDIESKIYLGMKKKQALKPYYLINNIKFISSGILGTLIFLNIYTFIIRENAQLNLMCSPLEAGIIMGLILVVLWVIFPFISFHSIKGKR
jgi:cell division protein FtsX